jgi:hypothetical protein
MKGGRKEGRTKEGRRKRWVRRANTKNRKSEKEKKKPPTAQAFQVLVQLADFVAADVADVGHEVCHLIKHYSPGKSSHEAVSAFPSLLGVGEDGGKDREYGAEERIDRRNKVGKLKEGRRERGRKERGSRECENTGLGMCELSTRVSVVRGGATDRGCERRSV